MVNEEYNKCIKVKNAKLNFDNSNSVTISAKKISEFTGYKNQRSSCRLKFSYILKKIIFKSNFRLNQSAPCISYIPC